MLKEVIDIMKATMTWRAWKQTAVHRGEISQIYH